MNTTRSVWTDHSLRNPSEDPRPAASCRLRWPRDSRLLQTALACCGVAVAQAARAQDTVPWKVEQVTVSAYAYGGIWEAGFGYQCGYEVDETSQTYSNPAGLYGYFAAGASVSYECCPKGGYYYGYGYGYGCTTHSVGAGASAWIGSEGITLGAGSCMEYQICSSELMVRVTFDRPMRMVWDYCCSGNDCCYSYGCAIDGSPCGGGSEEFPGAYILTYQGYRYGHYLTSYYFEFNAGSGEYSFAHNIRFERMFPADIVPDRIVDGSDISAILSKWGSGYDPQRTPEDVNLDGQVGAEDLALVLFAWDTPG